MNKPRTLSNGILFVVSAPSATGKTTVVERVLSVLSNISRTVSHTTRQARLDECNGRDYYFVSDKAFDHMVESRAFLEWAEVYGHRYGTSREAVDGIISRREDAILVIDWQGAECLRSLYSNAVFILLVPPSRKVLKQRMRDRGVLPEPELHKRLASAQLELKKMDWYDYVVVNDTLEHAVEDVLHIVSAERHRMGRQKSCLASLLKS